MNKINFFIEEKLWICKPTTNYKPLKLLNSFQFFCNLWHFYTFVINNFFLKSLDSNVTNVFSCNNNSFLYHFYSGLKRDAVNLYAVMHMHSYSVMQNVIFLLKSVFFKVVLTNAIVIYLHLTEGIVFMFVYLYVASLDREHVGLRHFSVNSSLPRNFIH